jgi:tetratricopeptide (TPR) repeat protein
VAEHDIEIRRAWEAVRRGWLKQEDLKSAVQGSGEAGILPALEKGGLLSADQIRRLQTATLPIDSRFKPTQVLPSELDREIREGTVVNGQYEVGRLLGEGSFGRVYLARSIAEDKQCALKGIRRTLMLSPESGRELERELMRWIRLGHHPNLIHAYGLEIFLRSPFIVIEYVDGARSLREVILEKPGDWKSGLGFACQIAGGMEHAGRVAQLIHRDLKPENVIVSGDGTAKITDFGLSVIHRIESKIDKDAIVGTPAYMAPEQWESPGAIDVRTDVYAFGVILFELLTGRRPFEDRTDMDGYRNDHVSTAPPDPRKVNPDVPESLAAFALSCLEKSPDRRPADFSEVSAALGKEHRAELGRCPYGGLAGPLPGDADALVNVAKTYVNLRLAEPAFKAAAKAVDIDPDHVNAHVILGTIHGMLGNHGEAIRSYEKAHELAPENLDPIANLASAWASAGGPQQTASWLDKAISRARELGCPERLEGVLWVAIQILEPDRALELCDEVIAANPLAVMAFNSKAILLRRMGRLDEALPAIDRALELNPGYAKGLANRANILIMSGRFDEAIESADQAISFDPETPGAYAAKAAALAELDRIEDAIAAVKAGLWVLPDHPLLTKALMSLDPHAGEE